MKKNLIKITGIAFITAALIAGCGSTPAETAATDTAAEETTETTAETTEEAPAENTEETQEVKEENTNLANPWTDVTEEEANEACARLFTTPEGAENVKWSIMSADADESGFPGPLVQATFNLPDYKDMEFVARARQSTNETEDISGLYYEWTVEDDITLINWGDGNMAGKYRRYIGDDETVDLITWFDIEIGISYSLSTSAPDLDGFDLQAVAEMMHSDENESAGIEYSDFLQYQSGVVEFKDYDEVISYLQPGQAYALIDISGSDEKALLIAEKVFDNNTTDSASLYLMIDGAPQEMTYITSMGEEYPIRIDENGVIYTGDEKEYGTYVASDIGTVMMQASVMADESAGEYTGFIRPGNDFEHDEDFTGGKEEFDKLIAARDALPAIEFTVVK